MLSRSELIMKNKALKPQGLKHCNHCDTVKPLVEMTKKACCLACKARKKEEWLAKPGVRERTAQHLKEYRAKPEVKQRRAEYMKEYMQTYEPPPGTKERVAAYDRKRMEDPKVRARKAENNRQWKLANKEHRAEYMRQYNKEYSSRPGMAEKLSAYRKQYRKDNEEYLRELSKQQRIKHADKIRQRNRNRRARELEAEGSFTEAEWAQIRDHYGHCLNPDCEDPLADLTRDHVQALHDGGTNYIWNIQPLCQSCNSSKRTDHIDYRPLWGAMHPLSIPPE